MFSLNQIIGTSLQDKTLCLTFDDGPGETIGNGPGPKTLKLAEYLRLEGITATFFVYGQHIIQYPHILPELQILGHIIGNHTYNHPHLTAIRDGAILLEEISKTEELILPYLKEKTIYFRAPYGDWNPQVAMHLNQLLPSTTNYKGTYRWDNNSCGRPDMWMHDWEYWRDGLSAQQCASGYIREINRIGKGIILMHDSSADCEQMKANNLTFETIQILVPELKKAGYRFIGLNEVTEFAE